MRALLLCAEQLRDVYGVHDSFLEIKFYFVYFDKKQFRKCFAFVKVNYIKFERECKALL